METSARIRPGSAPDEDRCRPHRGPLALRLPVLWFVASHVLTMSADRSEGACVISSGAPRIQVKTDDLRRRRVGVEDGHVEGGCRRSRTDAMTSRTSSGARLPAGHRLDRPARLRGESPGEGSSLEPASPWVSTSTFTSENVGGVGRDAAHAKHLASRNQETVTISAKRGSCGWRVPVHLPGSWPVGLAEPSAHAEDGHPARARRHHARVRIADETTIVPAGASIDSLPVKLAWPEVTRVLWPAASSFGITVASACAQSRR
jgi:hypothetical protein